MTDAHAEARRESLREHHLGWLVVHHFLPADLVRDLCADVVKIISNDSISLPLLFDERLSQGAPNLANWAIRPNQQDGKLERYLQHLVRGIAWQGDQDTAFFASELGGDDKARIDQVEFALALGRTDLDAVRLAREEQPGADGLTSLVEALAMLSKYNQETNEYLLAAGDMVATAFPAPLTSLIIKHLGDLCADVDRWDLAESFYRRGADLLEQPPAEEWRGLIADLRVIFTQSLSAALHMTRGATQAATVLARLAEETERPLPTMLSALWDSSVMQMMSGNSLTAGPERGALLLAPQLSGAHHTANALSDWSSGRFRDANRWFWAVLRRQIALGADTSLHTVKAQYGRSLIDEIAAGLSQASSNTFALGVRLLVEGGRDAALMAMRWDRAVIEAFVDKALIDKISLIVERNPGARIERSKAMIALFRKWLEIIPSEHLEPAHSMLERVATAARDHERSFFGNVDVGGVAMEALKETGKARPEFRSCASASVGEAVVAALGRADPVQFKEAIKTAIVYLDALSQDMLEGIVDRAIKAVRPAQAQAATIPDSALLELLSSDRLLTEIGRLTDFGNRAGVALIQLATKADADHIHLMYLFGDLPPALLARELAPDRLTAIVADIARRARQLNSSGAVAYIQALLVAPAVAGIEAVQSALQGLNEVIQSATSRPAIAFPEAYQPLLLLARDRADLVKGLERSDDEVRSWIIPMLESLTQMWLRAAEDPLLFTGFSIPPATAPNPAIVHNWAFASLELAKSLDQPDALAGPMAKAAARGELANAMATARAIRVADDADPFDPEKIQAEKADAFYSALGSRLSFATLLSDADRQRAAAALLRKCMESGPRGLDAGILLLANQCTLTLDRDETAAKTYYEKMRRDPELRLSLSPLFTPLYRSSEGDYAP